MEYNQRKYVEYIRRFAEDSKCRIWLGGSFSTGDASLFSDVDISVLCSTDCLQKLIYGYGKPVYISYTQNPPGILIVVYEDGVAADIEIIEKINAEDEVFFTTDDIKAYGYTRNSDLCKEFALREDKAYHAARLFHRSLIKYLSDKKAVAVSIANEIAEFIGSDIYIDEVSYKAAVVELMKSFDEQHHITSEYLSILLELIEQLDK